MPLVIAVLSAAGLLFALMGDGVWDWVSWCALGFPVAIGLWFAMRRTDPRRATRQPARPKPLR